MENFESKLLPDTRSGILVIQCTNNPIMAWPVEYLKTNPLNKVF